MDLENILDELRRERDRIGEAIAALMGTATRAVGRKPGRPVGRPPGSGSAKRGKGLTPAGRKRLSEMMKRRWAERRAKGGVGRPAGPTKRGKGLTPAGRKRLSEMMKRRWAERRARQRA